jgi:hypothetical protein
VLFGGNDWAEAYHDVEVWMNPAAAWFADGVPRESWAWPNCMR